jgi:hypothetical protein
MNHDRNRVRYRASLFAAIIAAASISAAVKVDAQSSTVPRYAANHDLLLPAGFESWVFVGSNLGLNYNRETRAQTALETGRGERREFHNVYINPEAYAHFAATGEFPVPTILVMERFAAADKEPNGILTAGMYDGDRVGLEVAVKNSARPDGKPTPWAYYDFTDRSDPSKQVASAPAFPDESCQNCHREHASRDNVWVQFYPVLRRLIK